MGFKISPQINIFEREDSGLSIEPVSLAIGAQAGLSQWGPAARNTLINGKEDFIERFGKPLEQTYLSFFIAESFLRYSKRMYFNRVVGPTARNAVSKPSVSIPCDNATDSALFNAVPLMIEESQSNAAMIPPQYLLFEIDGQVHELRLDESFGMAIEQAIANKLTLMPDMQALRFQLDSPGPVRLKMKLMPEEQNMFDCFFSGNPSADFIDGYQVCCIKKTISTLFFSYMVEQEAS